jgi:hypothetical protein
MHIYLLLSVIIRLSEKVENGGKKMDFENNRMKIPEKIGYTLNSTLPAKELRKISQRELLNKVSEEEIIGLIFNDQIKLSVLDSEILQNMVNRLNELEERYEEEKIANELDNRLDTPEEEWVERPPGMSMKDWYEKRKWEKNEKNKE